MTVTNFYNDGGIYNEITINGDNATIHANEKKPQTGAVEEAEEMDKDTRILKALKTLVDEDMVKYAYDYHVIMKVLQEKYSVPFDNGQSFVSYLLSNGITHKLPSADSINKKLSLINGKFPNWSWCYTDHNEEIRRTNIAKRFVHLMNESN